MFFDLVLWFALYSFIGWVWETVICSLDQREFVNRGFLNGPLCPIYGFGAILDILVLGQMENPLLIFLAGTAIATILEYFAGWLLETLFHARWWDYSHMRFNIKGRVSLLGMMAFGLFAVALILFAQPWIEQLTNLMPMMIRKIVALALLAVLVIDTVITATQISAFNQKLQEIQHHLAESISESIVESQAQLEGYLEKAKDTMAAIKPTLPEFPKPTLPTILRSDDTIRLMLHKLTGPERRVLKAFPQFSSTHYNEAVRRIRKHLKNLQD
ncbi:MAG: putative ABC transporter permease [Coriobacteriales bacterium]|jgi:uncharacterized membrane protein|nr:putative ABC transporter permease [Coriobacteriales bacterium]